MNIILFKNIDILLKKVKYYLFKKKWITFSNTQ